MNRQDLQTEKVRQLVKWGVKSVVALGLNLAILTVWVEVAGIRPEIAVLINWVTITVAMYVVTDRWVFAKQASPATLRGHVRRYLELEVVKGVGKVGNYLIFVALLRIGVFYQAAWAIGAVAMFALSFAGGHWLWTTDSRGLQGAPESR